MNPEMNRNVHCALTYITVWWNNIPPVAANNGNTDIANTLF